ncbi:MAG: DUF58 domain-containing protein [Firmicutes bacterium]|nr:DUF58 domain-containing protein [Bacillota bacterium]
MKALKGKLLWALWLLAASALYFFENNGGTRLLLTASFLLPLLLMLPLFFKPGKTVLMLHTPERAERGGSAEISAVIRYDNPALHLLRTELHIDTEYILTGDKDSLTPEFDGKGSASAVLKPEHCGLVKLSAELWGQDAFGICQKKLLAGAETVLFSEPLLYTPFVELVEDTQAEGEGGSYSSGKPGNDPSETFGIREYMPGDPIRQIHWKLSEKTGRTMLRELGMPVSSRAILMLDLNGAGYPDEMAELFFSVSRAMILSGQGHSLCWKHRYELQPRIFSVETEQDLAEALREFFAAAPEMEMGLGTAFYGKQYAHGLLICSAVPSRDEALAFGGRLTAAFPAGEGYQGASGSMHLLPFRPDSFKEDMVRIEI